MITFFVAVALLVLGYLFYGRFVDRFFGSDPERQTPAISMRDDVDYKPMPTWKIFVIQFLNIAGLGPIFGAILGAAYGPVAYIWIVVGCIFMGAVHDYFAGMMSIRNGGANMPKVIGIYFNKWVMGFAMVMVCFLLLALGVSFVTGPADLLASLSGWNKYIWLVLVFVYYIIATMVPIDKIIGKVYPFMGAALLFMAVGVGISMLVRHFTGDIHMVELSLADFRNYHADPESNIIVPMLFVVISCGAISGFHSTQSPLMARCLKNEKYARPIFYGAMIAEGIVALIWASAAINFFGGPEGLNRAASEGIMIDGVLTKVTPAIAVDMICKSWLGKVGAIIAIIGVVVCPITSGDTAFRSLRLTIADALKLDQKPVLKRFYICIPMFAIAFCLCFLDFSTIWKYSGICNQCIAAIILWTSTAYLIQNRKAHFLTSIPATFISFVVICYFLCAPYRSGGLNLDLNLSYTISIVAALVLFVFFCIWGIRSKKNILQ